MFYRLNSYNKELSKNKLDDVALKFYQKMLFLFSRPLASLAIDAESAEKKLKFGSGWPEDKMRNRQIIFGQPLSAQLHGLHFSCSRLLHRLNGSKKIMLSYVCFFLVSI